MTISTRLVFSAASDPVPRDGDIQSPVVSPLGGSAQSPTWCSSSGKVSSNHRRQTASFDRPNVAWTSVSRKSPGHRSIFDDEGSVAPRGTHRDHGGSERSWSRIKTLLRPIYPAPITIPAESKT